jgi:hypothetical protein
MKTHRIKQRLLFQECGSREVVADFEGGTISTDAGALLLSEIDAAGKFIDQLAECFVDLRNQEYVEHTLEELLAQRVFGICLGYEDLIDHETLRKDPLLATVCGKVDPEGKERKLKRDRGAALAGKSTLNRLELRPAEWLGRDRYKKIFADERKVERYFVQVFLDSYPRAPERIVLDVDATDDPLHGKQEGRFFHGYYDCYCYLPLYIFCADHLLCAKLRPADIDAAEGASEELRRIVEQIRERWPKVEIVVRGDSGFCRDELMSWCEANNVEYLIGMARNVRLRGMIEEQMKQAREQFTKEGKAARVFADFRYRTRESWSRERRVVGKAEYLPRGENPRFVVTTLDIEQIGAQALYEDEYCARGDMENRIKEQQLYLFRDRTSTAAMRSNQLRLWLSSVAYLIMNELRRVALRTTELAQASCETVRLKLLKIGAQVRVSVRRIHISMASGYPYQSIFAAAHRNIRQFYYPPG